METMRKYWLIFYGILVLVFCAIFKNIFNKQSGIPNKEWLRKLRKRREEVNAKIQNLESKKTDAEKLKKKYHGRPDSDITATIKRSLRNYKRLDIF